MKLPFFFNIWCLLASHIALVHSIESTPLPGTLSRADISVPSNINNDQYYYNIHAEQSQQNNVASKNFRIDENNQIVLNSDKNIDQLLLTDLIVVTQVNGFITGINRNTGKMIWSTYLGNPLIKSITDSQQQAVRSPQQNMESTVTHIENTTSNSHDYNEEHYSAFSEFWAVEPFNKGSLYFFTKETGLSKVPLSLNDLIMASPFSVDDDDKIFTGSRNTKMIHLDLLTGKILNDGNSDSAPAVSSSKTCSSAYPSTTVSIGITEYQLSIASKSDNTRWSISYMEISENNIHNGLKLQNSKKIQDATISPFQTNKLLAIDSQTYSPKWLADLNSSCTNVFDIFWENSSEKQYSNNNNNNQTGNAANVESQDKFFLVSHPMIQSNLANDSQLAKAGTFLATVGNGTWYVMSSQNYPSLVKSSPISKFDTILNDSELNRTFSQLSEQEFIDLVTGVHIENTITNQSEKNNGVKDLIVNKSKGHGEQYLATIIKDSANSFPSDESIRRDLVTLDKNDRHSKQGNIVLSKQPVPPSDHLHHSRYSFGYIFVRFIENAIFTALSILAVYLAFRYEIIPLKVLLTRSSKAQNEEAQEKTNGSLLISGDNSISSIDPLSINEMKLSESIIISESKILKTAIIDNIDENLVEFVNEDEAETSTTATDLSVTFPVKENAEKIDLNANKNMQLEGGTATGSSNSLGESGIDHGEETEIGEEDVKVKRKRKRGCRGGKNKKKSTKNVNNADNNDLNNIKDNTIDINIQQDQPHDNYVDIILKQPLKYSEEDELGKSKLIITDEILGYGSHGTIVYRGTFENRPVAVKRMLIDFYDVASHEVSLLQESDDHPNVVRYFCSRQSDKFLYIALELCEANLENMLINNNKLRKSQNPQRINLKFENLQNMLYQMTLGLQYLHKLSIVHRDIKPQNILVTKSKTDELRVLISDFGLCKKLDPDQSSFKASTLTAASGTTGWKAPELLLLSSAVNDVNAAGNKISKMIDVYSLGLVFYYVLTNGKHPFGDKFNREANMLQGKFKLDDALTCEAKDLITRMIKYDSRERLSIELILKHPFFWNKDKKIELLLKVSDKLNILDRDSEIIQNFERNSNQVFKFGDWSKNKFNQNFLSNINSFRKYDCGKLMDLLRVFRNKYHHINEIPEEFNINEHNFLDFFIDLYPNLLMYNYYFVLKFFKGDFVHFF